MSKPIPQAEWPVSLRQLQAELAGLVIESALTALPATLDHYTKLSTLEKVLQSRQFLGGDAVLSNDPRELEHGRLIVMYILTHYELQQPEDSALRHLIDFARFQFNDVTQPRYFLSCFSSADDELLEQWRAYGDNCRGVMITLDSRAAADCDYDGPAGPALRRVIYEDGDQATLVGQALRLIQDFAQTGLPGAARVPDPLLITASSVLCAHLAWQAVGFKIKWFRSEREWRFVQSVFPSDAAELIQLGARQFFPFRLGREERLPIRKVKLGPLCSADDETMVREVLAKYGYTDVAVERSRIPYRSTSDSNHA